MLVVGMGCNGEAMIGLEATSSTTKRDEPASRERKSQLQEGYMVPNRNSRHLGAVKASSEASGA